MVGMYIYMYEGTTWKDLEYPGIFSIRDTVCTDVVGSTWEDPLSLYNQCRSTQRK